MEIRYVKREDIDKLKWDSCVHYAVNGNAYGYTWYLDNICEDWDGLVEGDYESVFPLVWNTKLLGYKQLYQPFFAQQLGLYSVRVLSEKRVKTFLEHIPDEYRYILMNLNERMSIKSDWGFEVNPRPNYILDLNRPYEEIASHYSKNLKRNLKKAKKQKLFMTNSLKPEKVVSLFKTHQGPQINDLKERDYHTLHRIIYNAQHKNVGFLSGMQNQEGELIAAGFFLFSHHRITNLLPATTPEGKEKGAMPFLLDMLILMNSGKKVIFDFEGSSIPSIARFYASFGAKEVSFPQIKRNVLPVWMKWLRR